MLDIQREILNADLILCEMSDRNPNVFYELGLAHAIGAPAILVSKKAEDIPFDLRHIRVITYDYTAVGWEEKLKQAIIATAHAVEQEKETWPPPLVGPQQARKRYVTKQFDGRVGKIFVKNTSAYPFKVTLWHPDSERVFESWVIKPTSKQYLSVSGEAINIGNDWGIQIGDSLVRSVDEAGTWVNHEWRVSPETFYPSI